MTSARDIMSKHQRYANRKPIKYTHINALSAAGMVYVQPGFTARLPGFGIRRIQHLNNVGVVRDRGLFGGDMKYTTEEIKGLLEGITPGEWEYGSDSELVYTGCDGAGLVIGRARELVDRKFIAAAPTIIRNLLAEVERLSGENANLVSILESDEASVPVLQSECCELATKLQAAQAFAAYLQEVIADKELLVGQERKRVARECIDYVNNHASDCGCSKRIAHDIRSRYGIN